MTDGGKKDWAVHLAVCTETKMTANGGRDDKKKKQKGRGRGAAWMTVSVFEGKMGK